MRHVLPLLLALLSVSAAARDLYVDPDAGDDAADGAAAKPGDGHGPVKTIAHGLVLTQAGDTLHLAPRATPYRESLVIHERSGEPGRPITVDGHGATISGCDPLRPEDWVVVSDGLYRSDALYRLLKADDTVIDRMFLVFDGKMVHMGRTSKGTKAPFRKPEELAAGEWSFAADTKAFFIRLAPGRTLADSGVEIPIRKNGVAINGNRNEHLVIRNLTCVRVHNDGFNIHNQCRDVLFQAIAAYECGDDGFSAHDDCVCQVDGFTARGNSTGFTNVGHSDITLDHAWLDGNLAIEIGQMEGSVFTVRNTRITTSAERPIDVRGNPKRDMACHGTFDNVLIRSDAETARTIEVAPGGTLTATHVTTIGLGWRVNGSVTLHQSVVIDGRAPGLLDLRGKWQGGDNRYALTGFMYNGKRVDGFTGLSAANGAEAGSQAVPLQADLVPQVQAAQPVFQPLGAVLPAEPAKP